MISAVLHRPEQDPIFSLAAHMQMCTKYALIGTCCCLVNNVRSNSVRLTASVLCSTLL